ncbi:MAG: ActS/PrrB/RegB family redox-sensitive histidine kinase [Methylocystis sp.]|nr:ActS/PrrB/RegB family redox-sensitive histidine kinase [Methylocystis sp.]
MTPPPDTAIGHKARQLRIDTLIKLRWLAIAGQSIATLGTYFIFGFDFPIGSCLLAIALSAGLNIGLRVGTYRTFRLDDAEAAFLLGYDILQLAVLLYLTGGLANFFAMFLLAPVMISAVSLPRKLTLSLGMFMIGAATILCFDSLPLPWRPGEGLRFPLLYRAGVLTSLALSAAFIGIYAARVSDEARQLSAALAATELVLEREQHLSQLDGLAAAAAHELGTPLATVTLVTKELQKSAAVSAPVLMDDLALLEHEARRCRDILRKLASLGDDEASVLNVLALGTLIEEVVGPQRDFGVEVEVAKRGDAEEPACARNPGILYGLGNLVENAIDFARSKVRIEARWSPSAVAISIEDDGPGFAPAILKRLGDPYVSGRDADRRTKGELDSGLGLGLFIAKTLLERSGASIHTSNIEPPKTGARVTVTWPRAAFERGAAPPPKPLSAG